MNVAKLLAASAAIALITGMGAAVAQQESPRGGNQPSTAQHQGGGAQSGPAMRSEGQSGHSGEASQSRDRRETTGQAPREDRQNQVNQRDKSEKSEQGKAKNERSEQNRTTGQAPREERGNRASEQNKEERSNRAAEQNKSEQNKSSQRNDEQNKSTQRNEQNRTTGQAPREERGSRASEQNKSEQDRTRTERSEENRTTTGQGAAGSRANVNVNITPEKRTEIHETIIKERSAPRVSSVNFNLSVGTHVPRGGVRFAALPPRIVEIEPEWRGYEYFLVGDRIVIVDPKSMEIVAILDA